MNRMDHLDPELRKLLAVACDGTATQTQLDRLEERLRGDADALRFYFDYCQLESDLHMIEGAGKATKQAIAQVEALVDPAQPTNERFTAQQTSWRQLWVVLKRPTPVSISIAALVMCVMITAMAFMAAPVFDVLTRNPQPPANESPRIVAKLTAAHDVKWLNDPGGLAVGSILAEGRRLHLEKGHAEITFEDGTRCVLSGPCLATVVGTSRCQLSQGKLAAEMVDGRDGFRVDTPLGSAIDLGTRFGIQVHENGQEEVHVYDGLVEVAWSAGHGKSELRKRLRAGESLSFSPGNGEVQTSEADNEQFVFHMPSVEVEAATRWTFGKRGVVEQISGQRGSLHGDAKIEDGALLLNGGDARAVLPDVADSPRVDGSYTIMLWVKFDEIEAQNVLVRTDDSGPLASWSQQLLVNSQSTLTHFANDGWIRDVQGKTKLTAGKWYHVVISASEGGAMSLYVNGKLDAIWAGPFGTAWKGGNQFHVGGRGRNNPEQKTINSLKGAIAEIQMHNKCLSAAAVRKAFGNSRPPGKR